MKSDTFIIRRHANLRDLPEWLKERAYTASIYDAEARGWRTIALTSGGAQVGEVVVLMPALFPDALIAVLHGQKAEAA
ncbi:hypothetical protein [Rhodopila sp.]|uniref:hypothetical protein n=1 Tax=Rhodopila sp. TaxID=2480087 RepID=UPI003D1424F4